MTLGFCKSFLREIKFFYTSEIILIGFQRNAHLDVLITQHLKSKDKYTLIVWCLF